MSIENVRKWFMIHTYSGYEKKVKTDLEQKVGTLQLRDVVTNILVPEEETTEIVRGKPKKIYRKLFPAYVMLEMEATREENENYDHEAMENVKGVFAGGAIGSFVVAKINTEVKDKNISNIHGLLSTCMSDGETICIRIDYKYSLPIGIFKNSINQTVVASRRAWIGADGGKGSGNSDDEEYVYIGRNSTRYHLDPRCHYLYNDLRSVPLSEIAGIRNDNGARYQPCERCGNRAGTTVYIMPSGTRYHSDPDCSAIIAYVQRVKLSDVEYLGVCSYCGGRH